MYLVNYIICVALLKILVVISIVEQACNLVYQT